MKKSSDTTSTAPSVHDSRDPPTNWALTHGSISLNPITVERIWGKARRFKGIPVLVAIAWLSAVWIQIFLNPRGDFPNHWELGHRIASGAFIYENGLNYVYPPFWAMAHAPLTIVSPHLAQILLYPLAGISIILLIWILQRLSDSQLPLAPDGLFWSTATAIFLSSGFISRDLPEAGVNTALVALSWLALYLWSQRRTLLGGTCLGLAIALKCTPLLFVAWFALKRQWKMVACSMAAAVVFTLAPMLIMGPNQYLRAIHTWTAGVVRGLSDPDPSRGPLGEEKVENLSLRPALARYLMHLPYGHMGRPETSDDNNRPNRPPSPFYLQFLDLSPQWAGTVARLLMAALLVPIVWACRHAPKARDDPAIIWEGAAVSLLILLYSPITWKQHGVGALPALFLICRAGFAGRPLANWVVAAMGAYFVMVVVLNREIVGWEMTKLLDSYRVKTFALLLVLAVVLACRHKLAGGTTASPQVQPDAA
jgi:alpha-1,2-mannosyltransferase